MPNFHMHWLIALKAADTLGNSDDICAGRDKYFDYCQAFKTSVYSAVRTATSVADFRGKFQRAAHDLEFRLRRPADYDAITCFSAYMLGACGPDFWTLMSREGLPSGAHTAGIHFDFGHYNRTHHQFAVSGARLRKNKNWTLTQKAERAYFTGLATHFAADLVMHELVNVYAGAYNILTPRWEGEHGASSSAYCLWSTHNKVEHYWDTYVRYRWLGDWGTVWNADEAPGGPASYGLPLAEALARDARNLNSGLGEDIAKLFMKDKDLEHGTDLAGPKYHVEEDPNKLPNLPEVRKSSEYKKNEETEFKSSCHYLLERSLIFPRVFCDRVLARDGIEPFIYNVVVDKKDGAYPAKDVYAKAIEEATTHQMKDLFHGGLNEGNKLKVFSSRTNLGDSCNSFNYQIYYMCPRLGRLQEYGPTVFWEPKALIPFYTAAVQAASSFAGAYASCAEGTGDDLGPLGKFWNLDTGLGVEVQNVESASPYEVRTRIRLPHVTEAANIRIGHQRRDEYLGGKDKKNYDLPAKYSFKKDKPAFAVVDGPTVEKSEDNVETSMERYLRAIKTKTEEGKPTLDMSEGEFFSGPSPGPTAPWFSVPTDSICSENVVVRPSPLSARLSLEFEVPIVRLGDKEVTAFALYADHAGASAAPQEDVEHAAKKWLKSDKSQCLRFIEHTQGGDADDIRVDGERVRFTGRVLANLDHDPPWDTATREIEAKSWNNVIAPADVAKFCGQNIAVATCRRNVLKQKGDVRGKGEFWPTWDLQLYPDSCPTEHVFFTIFPLVRTRQGWFNVFTNKAVTKADIEAMRKIRCVGFVPIVLLYVCDYKGRAQLNWCYIDGLLTKVVSVSDAASIPPHAGGLDGPALAEENRLAIRVVDADGSPLADTKVRVHQDGGWSSELTTDHDGCVFVEGHDPGATCHVAVENASIRGHSGHIDDASGELPEYDAGTVPEEEA